MMSQLRPVQIQRHWLKQIPASVLYSSGNTIVLCTASVAEQTQPWLVGTGKGWVTAEYNMLPHSTSGRKSRDRSGKVDGRTTEIQRLIGRSFRSVVDLRQLGERTLTVDCDVLQADGGTRTASITGGFIAMVDALAAAGLSTKLGAGPLRDSVAAISVGRTRGKLVLDLDYQADSAAEVDMNVVMTGSGRFVEIQGTGEEATFDEAELHELLRLARSGIEQLTALQLNALS
jgi:ribonuclease PH